MFAAFARISLVFSFFLFSSVSIFAQPGNDDCSNAVLLTSYPTTCTTPTAGTVLNATNSNVAVNSCNGTPDDDVWYKFVAQSTATTISLTEINSGNPSLARADAVVEVFYASTGDCSSLTYTTCLKVTNSTSLTLNTSSLTVGGTYYIRVFSTSSGAPASNAGFNICVTHTPPPSNDECAAATTLSIGTTNSAGTVWYATSSTGIPAACTGTPDDDVWYKFTASASSATITLSSVGSELSTSGTRLQVFSGSCGSLTSIACGTSSVTALGLTAGSVYYIRVYSAGSGSIGGTSAGSAFSITVSNPSSISSTSVGSGRMNEVFKQTTLSAANILNDPWEIAYGPDGFLWVTEAKGYKVYRMDPNTGAKSTVLDISQNSSFLPASDQGFNVQFSSSQNPWPQGGFAGLALHPNFMHATTPKNYVYVSYVHSYVSGTSSSTTGVFFSNRIVRFTYNTATGQLESPVSLCDTLPGSSDHNSQRMIIAPVNGVNYLFYASGDMGAGQFTNLNRPIKSQNYDSYEGKILRFNLEADGDAGTLDKWIPNDNPFNGVTPGIAQSAVWCTGIRNNQGFASANINGTDYLYGSSHGPFSDDEINIIEKSKNYGHPLVIGYSADGNYNNSKAGSASGILPLIASESANATAIGANYKDPLFSAYAAPAGNSTTPGTINYIYTNNPGNGSWPSEGWSGMDIYTNKVIPGWKNSLVIGSLKWGRVLRLKLNTAGNAIVPTNGQDTVSYFGGTNRFRDVAFSPDGKDLFIIMDKSATTSGPSAANPVVPACGGCVQKYTFLGYQHNSGTNRSTIPSSIDITQGTANTLQSGTTITIDASNNNIWVPITGPDGNILAEIKANGNNLGTVTSSFYTHSGTAREDASKRLYLNRSITITPQNQPASSVNVRLYFTNSELTSLMGSTNSQGMSSGVSSVSNIKVLKNNDANSTSLTAAASVITPVYAEAHSGTNIGGYVLQVDITSFSSFYFGNPSMTTLPLTLINFKGTAREENVHLDWKAEHEVNTAHFIVERSTDGRNFEAIGTVKASGNSREAHIYHYIDQNASKLSSTTIYYRLKVVDADGAYQYSKIINVVFEPSVSIINIYPNPVEDVMNIRVVSTKTENVQILITNMQGRVVYSQNRKFSTGVNDIKVNTKNWPAQSYSIQILGNQRTVLVSKKIVKM